MCNEDKEATLRVPWTALAIVGGLAFFWLVVMKILARLQPAGGTPCPAALAWLVNNPIRRRYMHPVLDRVGIRPGERVLELGPGQGAFTVDAARRLAPDGTLIAVDIQPKMIAQVEKRIQEAGLTNVETHVADAYSLPLDDASVDRALLVTVLPEIPDQARALAELRRVIKPSGLLSITEEFLDPDYPFAFESIRRVEAAGFNLERRFGTFWRYTVNFRRSADVAH